MVHPMKALATLPSGVDEAFELAERLDEALLQGFARLNDEHQAKLQALARVFAGTPLGAAVTEALAAVGRSEFVPRSFLALAAARVALLGSVHDALRAQLLGALGRPTIEAD